jgi:hypothetical protein
MPKPHKEPEPPAPSASTLTVGEIAAHIHGLAGNPTSLTERLRHFGKLGLLVAVDRSREGTGRHARYPEDAVYDAAFLTICADAGLYVNEHRYLADAMSSVRNKLPDWKKARAKGRSVPLFIEIFFVPPGKIIGDVHDGKSTLLAKLRRERPDILPKDSFVSLATKIDLGSIFEHVWKSMNARDASGVVRAE